MALLKRFGVEIGDKGHSTDYPPTVIAEIAKELRKRVVQFVETTHRPDLQPNQALVLWVWDGAHLIELIFDQCRKDCPIILEAVLSHVKNMASKWSLLVNR